MESNLITERKVSGLSDAELISAYHKFRNEYKDLQIVKLINKNTNQSKVVFYSLHNGIFIDPVDGKLYKPIDFIRNALSYTHKQVG
ncbi:MAG: hypothetical protein N3E37_00610 [Candidatus Micrarchaeota archaeon]|nr:hypothetical protein [Candidatus Micrarchaeota archaeon]